MLVPTCDELAGGGLAGTPLNSVHLAFGHQLHGDVGVPRLLLQQQVEGQLRGVSSMVQAVVPSLQVVVGADVSSVDAPGLRGEVRVLEPLLLDVGDELLQLFSECHRLQQLLEGGQDLFCGEVG